MKLLYKRPIDKDVVKKPTVFLEVNQCDIRATESAVQYYVEQIREKIAFDARAKENKEFKQEVRTFSSYPNKYTLPKYYQDCLVSVWEDQCKKNPQLELDCIHDKTCQIINNCKCSPDWEVKLNEAKLEERYRLEHNLKRKSKKQKKKGG